jgi:hypothetical protein
MARSSAFQWHGHAAPTREENLVDVVRGLRILLVPRTLVLGAVHFLPVPRFFLEPENHRQLRWHK